jgi:hypothetical protein
MEHQGEDDPDVWSRRALQEHSLICRLAVLHSPHPGITRRWGYEHGWTIDIISTLNAATVEALADPSVRSQIVELGAQIFPREKQTPETLAALQRSDAEKWWPIIKKFGIKAE